MTCHFFYFLRVLVVFTTLSLLPLANTSLKAQDICSADTSFTDILFLIDNSGSIDDGEFELFSDLIMSSIEDVRVKCTSSQIGVVHYGGAFGLETTVEFPLARNSDFPDIQRQFCTSRNQFDLCSEGGGDDLNNAIGDIISFIQDGSLNRDPINQLALVIFTDAFGFEPECPFINCSVIRPFTNIDILKGQFGAQVTVVGVSQQAEASLLGLYASLGGTFDDVELFAQDCPSTFDGCTLPRKYIPLEFDSPVEPSSDSIASCVDCTIRILGGVSADAGPDQMICEEEDGTVTLTAQLINGTEPFAFFWDQGLGGGNNQQVAPLVTTTYTVTITDVNGCMASDMVTVFVESCMPDCPGPQITCPPDIMDCPGGSLDTSLTGSPFVFIDTSICDLVNVSFRDDIVPTDCPSATVIRRVWRAEVIGAPTLFDTCTQLISYNDVDPPIIINCPEDVILDPDNPVHSWEDPTVIDDCEFSLTYSVPSGSTFPTGQTIVVATAIDLCGNTDSCQFVVTVPDRVRLMCEPSSLRCVDTLLLSDVPAPMAMSDCPLCIANPASCITITTVIEDIRTIDEQTIYDILHVASDLCNTEDSCRTQVILDNSSFVDCPEDIVMQAPPFGFTDVSWPEPTYESCCDICIPRQIPGFLYMGQLGDSYYYCSFARVNWQKANRSAEDLGGHLVAINSEAENEFISRRLIEREAYIGLNDLAVEGNYTWTSGESLSFSNWKPSQPDGGDAEDVVEMDAQGFWYDVSGRVKREFVVEITDCNQVTQIGGPEPGSRFRLGTTTITYMGEDGCGNIDTCSFDVTLLPFEAPQETAGARSSRSTSIEISPNPTNSTLFIESGKGVMKSLQIINAQGQALRTWHTSGTDRQSLDIADLPRGVHFIKIILDSGTIETHKIMLVN